MKGKGREGKGREREKKGREGRKRRVPINIHH
jgi:hypothetical protein